MHTYVQPGAHFKGWGWSLPQALYPELRPGSRFDHLKMALDRLTTANFFPWPIDNPTTCNCVCANLSHTSWLPSYAGDRAQNTAWPIHKKCLDHLTAFSPRSQLWTQHLWEWSPLTCVPNWFSLLPSLCFLWIPSCLFWWIVQSFPFIMIAFIHFGFEISTQIIPTQLMLKVVCFNGTLNVIKVNESRNPHIREFLW